MEESALLTQKIEFLEFQLQDAQNRESSLKTFYESILKSLNKNNEKLEVEQLRLKLNEQRIAHDLEKITINEKLKTFERFEESLNLEVNSLKKQVLSIKQANLDESFALRQKIEAKDEEIESLQISVETLKEKMTKQESLIEKLQKEKDDLFLSFSEESLKSQQKHNFELQELKDLYQIQQDQLIQRYSRLESEDFSKSASSYFTSLLINLGHHSEKLQNIEKTLIKIKNDTKQSLEQLTCNQEMELGSLQDLSLKAKLEMTEKLVSISSCSQNSLNSIKASLCSLRQITRKTQEKQKILASQIDLKNTEIESLKKALFLRANQEKDTNFDEILKKDIEIASLKKIVGQLRASEVRSKPPSASPQCRRMKTLQIKTSLDEDSLYFTTASTDRNSDERLEDYRVKVEQLRRLNFKVKNQRDRAKALSEKLLNEIREKKVEVAVIMQNHSDDKEKLQNQVKDLCGYLKFLGNSAITSRILKQDIARVLNNYTQYDLV